ncbi:hypothetical protein [Nocardia pneumoniae]|nr:hypothetical protein [Nocardia pneumoniae]
MIVVIWPRNGLVAFGLSTVGVLLIEHRERLGLLDPDAEPGRAR